MNEVARPFLSLSMLLTSPDLAFLAAIAAARRSSAPGAPGGHRPGPRKGAGSLFAGHRAYAPGDDPRQIDWAAYARTEGLFIKEYREEVEGSLTVLLDLSSSMRLFQKHLLARRIAVAATVVALLQGDQARVLAFGGPRRLEPRGFGSAKDVPEADRHVERLEVGGSAGGLAAARAVAAGRRGRVLLVSDLLEEESAGPALVALREKGHAVGIAHVLAREELGAPEGLVRLRDAETGEVSERLVDAGTAAAYARALEEFCASWRGLAAVHGMGYARVLTDERLEEWAEAVC
jgi:uncharacterized protein (DUF58 family)